MIKYKFLKKEKNGEKIIQKTGGKVEFTMSEMDESRARGVKAIEEYKGNLKIRDAERQNIENNHPHVLEGIKDQDVLFKAQTLALYAEKIKDIDSYKQSIKNLEDAIAEHDEEVEEIKKQLG